MFFVGCILNIRCNILSLFINNFLKALYVAPNDPIKEENRFFNNSQLPGKRTTKTQAPGFDAFATTK
ncbi:hypothetical protein ACQWHR_24605, partial [Salmonella enterica subsp. enterica serovar Infantis]